MYAEKDLQVKLFLIETFKLYQSYCENKVVEFLCFLFILYTVSITYFHFLSVIKFAKIGLKKGITFLLLRVIFVIQSVSNINTQYWKLFNKQYSLHTINCN